MSFVPECRCSSECFRRELHHQNHGHGIMQCSCTAPSSTPGIVACTQVVRAAAAQSVRPCAMGAAALLAAAADQQAEVRSAALEQLSSVFPTIEAISPTQRCQLLTIASEEKEDAPRQAARAAVGKWLEECEISSDGPAPRTSLDSIADVTPAQLAEGALGKLSRGLYLVHVSELPATKV